MKILPAIVIVFMLLMAFVTNGVIAQSPTPEPTVLSPGDIIVVGYNTTGDDDEIAILFLKDVSINTEFKITDLGWDNTKTIPGFKNNDGDDIFSRYAQENYSKGKVINIIHKYSSSGFQIKNSSNGDQIFILQGNHVNAPNLIFGVNVNHTSWQNFPAPSQYSSGLPQQLINNNFFYEYLNAKYIGKTNFTDADSAKIAIMDPLYWQGSDTSVQDITFPNFTIGTTSVVLNNFSAKNKVSNIYLYFFLFTLEVFILILTFHKIFQKNKKNKFS